MQAYQQRVVIEREALSEKIAALVTFLDSKLSHTLPVAELRRLDIQKHAMIIYESVLMERIEAFTHKKETNK